MNDEARLLPPLEASRRLGGLPEATLQAWRSRGGGPAFVKLGRRVYYRPEDLEQFVIERRRTHSGARHLRTRIGDDLTAA
jgi:hypothetical protein